MKQVAVATLFAVAIVAGLSVQAQDRPLDPVAFEKPELLAEAMDRNSIGAVAALEDILTAEQAIEFEAAMLPPPPNETKRARYMAARKALRAAGVIKGDPALKEIKTLIDALPGLSVDSLPAREPVE